MNSTPYGIHIVGGGLAGYAAALALAPILTQQGESLTLYERTAPRTAPRTDSIRTTTINAVSYQFLQKLGIIAALPAAAISPIHRIIVSDDSTAQQPPDAHDPLMQWQHDQPLAWVIKNSDFISVMADLMDKTPTISRRTTTITGYHPQHPDLGAVAAGLSVSDTTDDHTSVDDTTTDICVPASLIIAADGSTSPLRQAAAIQTITRDPKQNAIVATLTLDAPHEATAWQKFLKTGPMALMPLSQPFEMALVWSTTNADAARLMDADDAAFMHAFNTASGHIFGGAHTISRRQSFPIMPKHARTPIARRLVLIGDAAHSIHPLAGQGYNLAIGDIMALAKHISHAKTLGMDVGNAAMLKAYARARCPEIATMTLATDGLNWLFSGGDRRRRVAGLGMSLANFPPIKALAERVASGRMFHRH